MILALSIAYVIIGCLVYVWFCRRWEKNVSDNSREDMVAGAFFGFVAGVLWLPVLLICILVLLPLFLIYRLAVRGVR